MFYRVSHGGFMLFTIFKRPKPLFQVGQIVFIPGKKGEGHYMQVQERGWVKQCEHPRWDWFYSGLTFRVEGKLLALKCREESYRENEIMSLTWLQ